MPTSHNSSIYADPAQSSPDAGSVMILRHAGALLLGKTTTPEFAAVTDLPAEGRTVNPHDTSRSAGGSSTGSAAAVADFQAPLALGTQTAGSVVRPASFCGVWGFKPTWGAVTREGQKTCAVTLDTLGWMGRSGKDLEVLAEVFGIRDDDDNDDDDDKERKEEIGGLEGKKFGVMKTVMWAKHAEPATVAALDKAVALLKAHGAVVEEIELPGDLVELPKWHEIVMAAEAGKAFLPEYTVGKDKLHDLLVGHVENRNRFSHADYLRASDGIAVARPRVDELLGQYEAVLTPSAPGEAPVGPGWTGSPAFNLIWTVSLTSDLSILRTIFTQTDFEHLRLSMFLSLMCRGWEARMACLLACPSWHLDIRIESCWRCPRRSGRSSRRKAVGNHSYHSHW